MTLTFSPRRCMVMTMCFMHAKINLIGQLVPDRVAPDGRTDRTDRITFPVRKVRTRSVKILLTVRDDTAQIESLTVPANVHSSLSLADPSTSI